MSIWTTLAGIASSFLPGGQVLGPIIGGATDIFGAQQAKGAIQKGVDAQLQAILEAGGLQTGGKIAATEVLRGGQQQSYEALLPYLNAGNNALIGLGEAANAPAPEFSGQLNFDPANVQNSPFFQQTVDEAMKALSRSAAGRGRLFAGGTAKDLIDYAKKFKTEDYAQEYARQFGLAKEQLGAERQRYDVMRQNQQDRFGRLFGIGEMGRSVAGQASDQALDVNRTIAGLESGTGANLGNLALDRGNVVASGYGARGAINTNMINSIGDRIGDYLSMRQSRRSVYDDSRDDNSIYF